MMRTEDFRDLVLDEGRLLRGVRWERAENADELVALIGQAEDLGATRGGGRFSCVPEVKTLPVAGTTTPLRGMETVTGWQVRLETTLLQCRPERMAELLGGAEKRFREGMTILIPRDFTDSDYIDRLCWVGESPGGRVLLSLDGALNEGGLRFDFHEGGEGEMKCCFRAHSKGGEAPCAMIFF